ncbi:MAG: hypothetical protein BMS9Abin26_1901 [Gammaproteobacteria bacterium]|nr:MAG: hypothetical protein BMS9Abin26_1901 [Gammaproteobacteria bacterium]
MPHAGSVFQELTSKDFDKIKMLAVEQNYRQDDLIFAEGDAAEYIYFIESGRVSISIQKFTVQEEICTLGPGEYFGEMAIFSKDKRSASVTSTMDTVVLSVNRNAFLNLIKNDRAIADKVNYILSKRNEELILKESLIDSTGINSKNLHVSIKGDPSLRESAFARERYQSVVDQVLPELCVSLEELLLNRCVYQIFIGFNNGEIRTSSVLDPFREELHPVNKLVDKAYIDRHFPLMPYTEKAWMVKRIYSTIADDSNFAALPAHFKKIFCDCYDHWEPMPASVISSTISRLTSLRDIPDFYLRNITISIARDAIRMQFNCDGTHIVSAEDYERFIEENLEDACS